MTLQKAGTWLVLLAPIGIPALFYYGSYMGSGSPPPLPVILGTILFCPFWCFISWFISHASGWQRLAAVYPARTLPAGKSFNVSGRIGTAYYQRTLYVSVDQDGLFLSVMFAFRIGHKPLFIPWTAIHDRKVKKFLWREDVEFAVGTPCLNSISLPKKIFENDRATGS